MNGHQGTTPVTCPTSRFRDLGEHHATIGCGSTNVTGPDTDGIYDCAECGMWFLPEVQAASVDDVVDDDGIPPEVLDRIVQRIRGRVE